MCAEMDVAYHSVRARHKFLYCIVTRRFRHVYFVAQTTAAEPKRRKPKRKADSLSAGL